MKIAIMQPYIFPYFGYYQLINAVDEFVVLDDVNFIKKGFINRNFIGPGDKKMFSIPLKKPSQNVNIRDTLLSESYEGWRSKFLTTLKHQYSRFENFPAVYDIVSDVLHKDCRTISELSAASLLSVAEYLDIKTNFLFSGDLMVEGKFDEKIISTCKRLGASQYINPIGGQQLYSKKKFLSNNIELSFLKSGECYEYMSIIDVLMKFAISDLKKELSNMELL